MILGVEGLRGCDEPLFPTLCQAQCGSAEPAAQPAGPNLHSRSTAAAKGWALKPQRGCQAPHGAPPVPSPSVLYRRIPSERQGRSTSSLGPPQSEPSGRGWCHTYPVLVIDDLDQAAVLGFDGRRRHGPLGLGRLGCLLLQLLLWAGAWVSTEEELGSRRPEVRLSTASSESAGTLGPPTTPPPRL